MRKYSRDDQKALASAALAWARRVLPSFEAARPNGKRPRVALQAARKWIDTGTFSMSLIRGASLAAHAAAREAGANRAASAAAHAAGQAVATAHVAQHAWGAAYYALKAVAALEGERAKVRVDRERGWQARRLPRHLQSEFLKRVVIGEQQGRIVVSIKKGAGY